LKKKKAISNRNLSNFSTIELQMALMQLLKELRIRSL